MKKFYLMLISLVFLFCVSIILIFGHTKIFPLTIVILGIWTSYSHVQSFLNLSRAYTGIAIVRTILPSESIEIRKKSFHLDLFICLFFSLLCAFGSVLAN